MASLETKNVKRSRFLSGEIMELSLAVLLVLVLGTDGGIGVVYMSSHCNGTVNAPVGGLMEPESALYYRENIDCRVTLAARPNYKMLLQFHRFALETATNGKCLDSLQVFEGETITGRPLTPELCGRLHMLPDVVSNDNHVTFHFKTDDGGRGFGFGIYFTQFTEVPCSAGQFECNNSRCIDPSLVCNTIDMCGDWSDESNCTAPPPESGGLSSLAIAGIGVSVIVFCMAIVMAIIALVQNVRNRRIMKRYEEEVARDMKLNPYSTSNPSIDNMMPATTKRPPEGDVGLGHVGGKVFGRKRSSKVAPILQDKNDVPD